MTTRTTLLATAAIALSVTSQGAGAEETIRIGQTMPYSGPASAYGQIGETESKCFDMINEQGGINGRKIEFISLDDGYSPPKTVEQTRKLVESEEVLFTFQSLGTPTNSAVHKYYNQKEVPQLFVATGATKWGDPENYPWTMGWQPNYQTEAKIYAQYIRDNLKDAKIAILYQNDDYGKDYLKGFKDGLGDMTSQIVAELPYEVTDPTVDSQIISAKASGADVFFNITTPKFAAQAIKKAHEIGWKPTHFLNNVSISVGAVLEPAGLEASTGLISAQYQMDPTDSQWQENEEFKEWTAFMDKYHPDGDKTSSFTSYGYAACLTLKKVLEQAGDDLSRENIMKQAANLQKVRVPMLLPGITVSTSPSDFYPIESMQLSKFNGKNWELFGDIISAESGSGT
jgi:ABC-type branched-subunit amino acid transport system substrate-binding protein